MLPNKALWILIAFALPVYAQQKVPLSQIAQQAEAITALTAPGSNAFHLKAVVKETTNPDSGYHADIEEYWVSPQQWRRTVAAEDFSQTIVVNGDQYFEKVTGDYYPQWLRNLVTGIFDPLPMAEQLKDVKMDMASPTGAAHMNSCVRFQSPVGSPPAQNSVFSVFCFTGNPVVVESAVTPGYSVRFKDYKGFGTKKIARTLISGPEPGTEIQANVTELSPLAAPDSALFLVKQVTLPADRLTIVHLSDDIARHLSLDTPAIRWPKIRDGKTSGVLSVYVCVDRKGQVREVWPRNSDNPGLDDDVRAQVMKWKFKPAAVDGVPVQFETILTFAFGR